MVVPWGSGLVVPMRRPSTGKLELQAMGKSSCSRDRRRITPTKNNVEDENISRGGALPHGRVCGLHCQKTSRTCGRTGGLKMSATSRRSTRRCANSIPTWARRASRPPTARRPQPIGLTQPERWQQHDRLGARREKKNLANRRQPRRSSPPVSGAGSRSLSRARLFEHQWRAKEAMKATRAVQRQGTQPVASMHLQEVWDIYTRAGSSSTLHREVVGEERDVLRDHPAADQAIR